MAYVDTLFGHQSEVVGVAPQRREARGDGRTRSHVPILEGCGGFATHLPALSGRRATRVVRLHLPGHVDHRLDDGTVSLWSTTKTRRHLVEPHVHGFGGQGGAPHGIVAP